MSPEDARTALAGVQDTVSGMVLMVLFLAFLLASKHRIGTKAKIIASSTPSHRMMAVLEQQALPGGRFPSRGFSARRDRGCAAVELDQGVTVPQSTAGPLGEIVDRLVRFAMHEQGAASAVVPIDDHAVEGTGRQRGSDKALGAPTVWSSVASAGKL